MLTRSTALFVLTALLYAANPTLADIYKWVDDNGTVHFSDSPPTGAKSGNAKRVDLPRNSAPDAAANRQNISSPDQTPVKPAAKVVSNTVEIYITDWCKYCKQAMAFMNANRINFTAYDVEKDASAARRVRELGGNGGVPFAVVNGVTITGFSEGAYRQALNWP